MTQILCVRLNSWPIDRIRRRQPALRHKPLVLVETSGTRQVVMACSEEAARFGIRPGLTLAQAKALNSHILHLEHDPARDQSTLFALGRWCMRFSPRISVMPPDAFLIDITGTERLLGSPASLLQHISRALSAQEIHATLAIAPYPGAAWALASVRGNHGCIVDDAMLPTVLSPLPVAALRLEAETCQVLGSLGIRTIGQLMQLPRESLPSRLGPEILLRLDQAFGQAFEPLLPLKADAPVESCLEFDDPLTSLEAVHLVLEVLVRQVVEDLARRGCGARELRVELRPRYAAWIFKTIRLAAPSRQVKQLLSLLRCVLENLTTAEGFIAIRLTVPVFERTADQQICFNDSNDPSSRDELARLFERLTVRLGREVIAQPRLVASHLPEHAVRRFDPMQSDRDIAPNEQPPAGMRIRPLRLLAKPVAISAVVSPSPDGDGRPISYTHRRQVHRLLHVRGPERIASEWWRGRFKQRDYFDVEDALGQRAWIFRVVETGLWFLHGVF